MPHYKKHFTIMTRFKLYLWCLRKYDAAHVPQKSVAQKFVNVKLKWLSIQFTSQIQLLVIYLHLSLQHSSVDSINYSFFFQTHCKERHQSICIAWIKMWINVNVFSEMCDYIPWTTKAFQLDIHTRSLNDRRG